MKENQQRIKGRHIISVALPVLCLLLLAALVLETIHILSLYRGMNTELLAYKGYADAERTAQARDSVLSEQARLFVYSGNSKYISGYFNEADVPLDTAESEADSYGVAEQLAPIIERTQALREAELHAITLAAFSYGLDIKQMPRAVAIYPLTDMETRMNSEQKRDEANALLYGEAYCDEYNAIRVARREIYMQAQQKAQERIREMEWEVDKSLILHRVLLFVNIVSIAGLILFLRKLRRLETAAEQKRVAELEEAKRRAETEDRTKTAFLLNVSHNIRTPVNEIIGFTNLAQKHIEDPQRVQEALTKIKSSGGHMINIINDILDLDRIESGSLEITTVPADMMRAGEEINEFLSSQAATQGVNFKLWFGDIPDRYVHVDIMHTVRVLLNLCSNAIKFTPQGGHVVLEVEQCGAAREGQANYRFTVRDTGIGMNPDFVSVLFDPYAREKNARTLTQGVGLGLSITKRLVERMGGTITVESTQGKGTVFTVTVPLKLQTDAEIRANYMDGEQSAQSEARHNSLVNMRVLLADDNELSREITAEILRSEGALTEKAADGAEALRLFADKPEGYYSLVLLDSHMPVLNGYETAQKIRALSAGQKVPIIGIVSTLLEEDKVDALAAGMHGVLTKPLNIGDLLSMLRMYSC